MNRLTPRISIMGPLLAGAVMALPLPALADVLAGAGAWTRDDDPAAIREWETAAAQGDAAALYKLGQAYRLGKGVPQDLLKAEELFGKAAAQGHVEAADSHGVLRFQRGDRSGALPYLIEATARGDAQAQYLLGIANFEGDGVPQDWIRAYALLTLARQEGLPQADTVITQMDARIPLYERQKGEELASQLGAEIELKRARQFSAADADASTGEPASAPEASATAAAMPPALIDLPPADTAPDAAPLALVPSEPPVLDIAAIPVSAVPPKPMPAPTGTGSWRVQLGAFGVRANADAYWNRLKDRPEIAGRQRINVGTGRVKRLLAGGFATEEEAKVACSRLAADGFGCFIVGN